MLQCLQNKTWSGTVPVCKGKHDKYVKLLSIGLDENRSQIGLGATFCAIDVQNFKIS